MFKAVKRTEGVSTTDIVRLWWCSADTAADDDDDYDDDDDDDDDDYDDDGDDDDDDYDDDYECGGVSDSAAAGWAHVDVRHGALRRRRRDQRSRLIACDRKSRHHTSSFLFRAQASAPAISRPTTPCPPRRRCAGRTSCPPATASGNALAPSSVCVAVVVLSRNWRGCLCGASGGCLSVFIRFFVSHPQAVQQQQDTL
jgi:hypothetical protein